MPDLIVLNTNAYNAARNEIVERIKLRQEGLPPFNIISVGKDKMREIPYIIPFLLVGISTIVLHHNITIGEIASYILKDLKVYFDDACH